MTRFAPTLTLLTVAGVGAALFVANAATDPTTQSTTTPAAATAGATAGATAPGEQRREISLADVPVAGADRTEVSLADIPVAPSAPDPVSAPEYSAPAEEAAGEDSVYAGWTKDRDLSVAVAVNDGQAVAYVCDNAEIEAWLKGGADGGELSLESKSGRSTMTGAPDAERVEGTVTVDGEERSYSADATDVATAETKGRADVGEVAARAGMAP